MCTTFTLKTEDCYFGRNMDLEYSFGEQVVIVPRNMSLNFKLESPKASHYAIIGMAAVVEGYPLFAEGLNEKGLYVAGLNFPGYAVYSSEATQNKLNLAPYEIISYILASCKSAIEAKQQLENANIVAIKYSEQLELPTLHWYIADKKSAFVLESTMAGIKIYDNPVEVLTNSPTFDFQITNLANYMGCSKNVPQNNLTKEIPLSPLGQGAGAIGIPGDSSPVSRFVQTFFTKTNSYCEKDEYSSISQVFHILEKVAMVKGTVVTPQDKNDITTYSCCINADKGIYYYKTYDNSMISAVNLFSEQLEDDKLFRYPLETNQKIFFVNKKA